MARIRIVDDWLRSPASPPTHYRSIMVVADAWAEQRVLMRAYADSVDQTRPTIVLHGQELAIGPAGIDAHDSWGIHVQPPVDGRAQELKDQLELAARRIAGSKGTPPRLADEQSPFDRKRTNNWAPGAPRDPQGAQATGAMYEPQIAAAARSQASMSTQVVAPQQPVEYIAQQPAAQYVPQQQPAAFVPPAAPAQMVGPSTPSHGAVAAAPVNPGERKTPVPMQAPARRRGWTSPVPLASQPGASPARTALGYDSGAGAQNAVIRLGLRPAIAARLGRLVDRTVPSDFAITPHERDVLNALGEAEQMTARQIGQMLGVPDPVTWMERLVEKLAVFGLDLVGPGTPSGGEPTYVLRR